MCIYTPIIRVWYFGFIFSFPLFRALTKPGKLLLNREKITDEITDENDIELFGLYRTKTYFGRFIINSFHTAGSIIWTIAYVIIIEEFLIFFMLICFIFRKNYFRKFLDCFYLFAFLPV